GQRVFLGTVRFQAVHRSGIADLDGTFQGQPPGVGREEACSEGVTHTGRIDGLVDLGRRHVHTRLLAALDTGALGPQRGDTYTDTIQDFAVGPAAFLLGQGLFVLVGEQEGRSLDEAAHFLAFHTSQLLRGVGCKGDGALTALLTVADHGGRIIGTDEYQVQTADAVRDRFQFDVAGLGHGPCVKGRDLVLIAVGRADEARGVPQFGDEHRGSVHTVTIQPGPVFLEVGSGGTDQDGPEAEPAQTEADVGRYATTPN